MRLSRPVYLYEQGCVFLVQEVHPYKAAAEPALQDDDGAHHFLVESLLKSLSLALLQKHLVGDGKTWDAT